MPSIHHSSHPVAAIAERLYCSAALRHLLFLLAAATTILLLGYYFGTFDQSVHIPFLRQAVDPTLYPGDRFFDLRHQFFSYFWFFFEPFYRLWA
jgi:hypothetical protein